jgi:hypothetical protein
MEDYRRTLKKAGKILIAIGAIDVAVMIACFLAGHAYSSSLNVFAIAAGIFLFRGRLNTALWVTRFGAFLLTGWILILFLVFPSVEPLSLWIIEWRLQPVTTFLTLAVPAVLLPVLVWVYRLLRQPEVLAALEHDGMTAKPPRLWIGMGAALALFMAVMLHVMFNGEGAKKAIELARAQNGTQYEYTIRQIATGADKGSAVVTAFKDDEIKDVSVKW